MIEYALTKHAETMLKERGIQLEWLERILLNPVQQHVDLTDPALNHAIGPIVENGDRLLRVIYNDTEKPLRIVTAYFDRTLRKSP
jgi:Domain of unknown function (DUF4258)